MSLSNPFTDIQISIKGNNITFQYKVDPAFAGRLPYRFVLLAYQDETFQTVLYTVSGTSFYITDTTGVRQNSLPNFFYKLKLIDANNKEYTSNFIGWHPSDSITRHHYLLTSEIARREHIRFNYAGLFGYLLKRKAYSATQKGEVDEVTGEPLIDDTKAYGVGTDGGYYTPVLFRFSIEKREIQQIFDENGRGTQFVELIQSRTVGFPFIDQHDIIVTPDGKRFTVSDPFNKYFPGTTLILLQTPTLRLIPPTDTVYSIDIPAFPINE